ncbi:MAG: type II secretion system GspH family protein [Bacteroidales bacterium]|nr:type II secretion system GspH family protein [Bacteroidales bacterium]
MLRLKKIRGSTLIEVIVSLIIIMILSGIVIAIILNVQHSYNLDKKYDAYILMNNTIYQSKSNEMATSSESWIESDYTIDKEKIIKLDIPEDVWQIEISSPDGKVTTQREILFEQ